MSWAWARNPLNLLSVKPREVVSFGSRLITVLSLASLRVAAEFVEPWLPVDVVELGRGTLSSLADSSVLVAFVCFANLWNLGLWRQAP